MCVDRLLECKIHSRWRLWKPKSANKCSSTFFSVPVKPKVLIMQLRATLKYGHDIVRALERYLNGIPWSIGLENCVVTCFQG